MGRGGREVKALRLLAPDEVVPYLRATATVFLMKAVAFDGTVMYAAAEPEWFAGLPVHRFPSRRRAKQGDE